MNCLSFDISHTLGLAIPVLLGSVFHLAMNAWDIWKTVPLLTALIVVIMAGVAGVVKSPSQSTQIIGFCTLSVLSLTTMIQQMLNSAVVAHKAQEVADKVEVAGGRMSDFAADTTAKMDKLAIVARDTHTLVNDAMGRQLTLTADLANRLAEETGLESDKKLSDDADTALRDHNAKQKIVDDGKVA